MVEVQKRIPKELWNVVERFSEKFLIRIQSWTTQSLILSSHTGQEIQLLWIYCLPAPYVGYGLDV